MAAAPSARAQLFSSGSTGADGALNIPSTSGTVTLDLPADGIFHFTTIQIENGATLKFRHNALNTPAYLLATGDVVINGRIDVSGLSGTSSPPAGGRGGVGGFDGGMPGILGVSPGDGHGPGGGKGGTVDWPYTANSAGSGSYGGHAPGNTPGNDDYSLSDGAIYGSPLLAPLVGGSGGGGTVGQPGRGGAGGGGALLIASSSSIFVGSTGQILAKGGDNAGQPASTGQGSGGGVRLIAPKIAGNGVINVSGGRTDEYYQTDGGHGRARIDTLDRSELLLNITPVSAASVGSFMKVFIEPLPRLDIISAAGQAIPEGHGGAVQVILPFEAPTTQTVTLQARNFKGTVPVDLVLIPDNGGRQVYNADIDMGGADVAQRSIEVQMPKNTVVHIYAWTR